MAFASGEDLYPNPPAYRLGIDVMRLQHPERTTYPEFVESISEQVRRRQSLPFFMPRKLNPHTSSHRTN